MSRGEGRRQPRGLGQRGFPGFLSFATAFWCAKTVVSLPSLSRTVFVPWRCIDRRHNRVNTSKLCAKIWLPTLLHYVLNERYRQRLIFKHRFKNEIVPSIPVRKRWSCRNTG